VQSPFYWTKGQWTKVPFHNVMQERIFRFMCSRARGPFGEEMRNALTTLGLGAQMLILLTLLGCSARTPVSEPEGTGCELNLNAVCAIAIENYAAAGSERSTQREPADGAHLVPLVVPVALTGGDGTAEVDCYVSTDSKGPWLVYAHETVLPESPEVRGALRDEDLCAYTPPERRLVSE